MSPVQFSDNNKKCGEISAALKVGKRVYALNCIFCAEICLQLEAFVLHVEQEHKEELSLPSTQLAHEERSENNSSLVSKKETLEVEDSLTATHQNINTASQDFQDPLEESSFNLTNTRQNELDVEEGSPGQISNIGQDIPQEHYNNQDDAESSVADIWENENESESSSKFEDGDDDDVEFTDRAAEITSDDRALTLALITAYKDQRILWNVNERGQKNRKSREDAFKRITKIVNKEMGLKLNWHQVEERIRKLRFKYRREVQIRNRTDTKSDEYKPLWYFKKLSFLNTNSISETHRNNKKNTKTLPNEKSALPLSNLNDSQNQDLIEIYKSYPCLWDVQHIGFRFKNQRQDAMQEMLQAIKVKTNLDLSIDELQKKLYRIRYACTREKHRQLECERLQQEFKPVCKYYEQISFLNDSVGPFKCDYCGQIFNGADQYRIHKSQHDGSMPFTCPLCQRGFMKVGNCTVHLRRHTRDYQFECKVCGKRFATTTDINVHMRYHTGEKPYFCEICGQSFRTWTFFDAHMRRHQKRPSHKCTICSKAFYENNKLKEHMNAHLNVRDKVCNVCGKAFTSSKYLRQHKQIHAEKKKYSCKICGKDFAQYGGLSGHMKSHGTTVKGAIVVEATK